VAVSGRYTSRGKNCNEHSVCQFAESEALIRWRRHCPRCYITQIRPGGRNDSAYSCPVKFTLLLVTSAQL